jgi:ABC-type sugar transport system ATPase subunit
VRTPLLTIGGLSKSFPGVKALDNVSLQVSSGEIVAIVGHNGSGKSTLVKVLAGVHSPDPGATIELHGGEGDGHSGRPALHFIHQDLGLIDTLTTVENLGLARPVAGRDLFPIRDLRERRDAARLIARFGASFDVTIPVGRLSPGERAIVAIARALDGWTEPDGVLVLDEPTTAFHGDEVTRLFEAVRRVADAGAGIVFISHRLDEVLGLAHRVVALRDGRVVADEPVSRLDHDRVVTLIAGRAVAELAVSPRSTSTQAVMEVNDLTGEKLDGVGFSLCRGEVLGVSGLLGSGREEVAELLFGARRPARGRVTLEGQPLPSGDVTASIARGMAFVPADRRRSGAVMDMNVRENVSLPVMGPLRRRFYRLDGRAERAETHRWMSTVALAPADPERPLRLFSGGNQQKVVLAKWLRTQPRVLLLEEPTQGVDVGAKAAIYELVMDAARAGAGVLICSSDTKELVTLCHRVIVLEGGRVVCELAGESLTEARLVREELGRDQPVPASIKRNEERQHG